MGFGKTYQAQEKIIGVQPMEKMEILPYPKEEVEHLIDQLIRLYGVQKNNDFYSSEITDAMNTINEALRLMIKPVLYIK